MTETHESAGWTPEYADLYSSGELKRRARYLRDLMRSCRVCPRECGVDRVSGSKGICHSGCLPVVSSYCTHFGEEPLLVGKHGVGNVFFGNCNLKCVFCQNYEISQRPSEEAANAAAEDELAEIMITFQRRKCGSVGFVSPTHFAPQILGAVSLAVPLGLRLPLIYNTNSYDSVDVLRQFEGVTTIYLPDLKYSSADAGLRYSGVPDCPEVARKAIKEMYRQVGSTLHIGEDGLVKRGLVIRLLVLPNGASGTEDSLRFIADELSNRVTVSLMAQYYPAYQARRHKQISRPVSRDEYERAVEALEDLGFRNGWV